MPITQPTKVTVRNSGPLFDDQSNSSASKLLNSTSSTRESVPQPNEAFGIINDRVNEHSQGYIGLLSDYYFGGVATETIIGADDVDTFINVNLALASDGLFDNRPTDMKADTNGFTGAGTQVDPYVFTLEGLDTTSFATFRVSMDFTPIEDEGQIESRILFDRHTGTSPSEQFSIEEVSLSMAQGADIAYTSEPLLSFFVGDSIDTNAAGDAGKVRFQIKSNVEGTLKVRALTLYVNK